jgi:hypothetical protein
MEPSTAGGQSGSSAVFATIHTPPTHALVQPVRRKDCWGAYLACVGSAVVGGGGGGAKRLAGRTRTRSWLVGTLQPRPLTVVQVGLVGLGELLLPLVEQLAVPELGPCLALGWLRAAG